MCLSVGRLSWSIEALRCVLLWSVETNVFIVKHWLKLSCLLWSIETAVFIAKHWKRRVYCGALKHAGVCHDYETFTWRVHFGISLKLLCSSSVKHWNRCVYCRVLAGVFTVECWNMCILCNIETGVFIVEPVAVYCGTVLKLVCLYCGRLELMCLPGKGWYRSCREARCFLNPDSG